MDADARELLARLVAYPTVAGEPNGELLAFAAEHLAASGATVTLVDGTRPDGHNLHAALGPASEPGVVLAAHTATRSSWPSTTGGCTAAARRT
jgi:acetylornithine deacetylase